MIGAILIESPKWCDKQQQLEQHTKNFKEPNFLVVITGGKYAYTTEDDVNIIHYRL
mgnify:CR=1 FL=1